jgi:hypothetical protein
VGRMTSFVYFSELKKIKKKRRMDVGGNRLKRKMTLREERKEMGIHQQKINVVQKYICFELVVNSSRCFNKSKQAYQRTCTM